MALPRGRFITLEGVDGAGKSSHVDWIANALRTAGRKVLSTREPGGTPLAEKLRELLLSEPMSLETETMLMFAARCEHVGKVIEPALAAGTWVVCDRFTDASYAYQGGGRGLPAERIAVLAEWAHGGLAPDCTLLFDVPFMVARARMGDARQFDRFEREGQDFFERVRKAYLDLAAKESRRFRLIDSTRTLAEVRQDLQDWVEALQAPAAAA